VRPNRINEDIRVREVRLIDAEGAQAGIMSIRDALEKSKDSNMDLVEISPNAEPPVCRIMDYGRFLYEKSKAAKEQKKKQKVIQVKVVQFSPRVDQGDFDIKLRRLTGFIEEGNKVKVTLRFRGREMAHQEIGMRVLKRIQEAVQEFCVVESMPKMEGRQAIMMLAPKKKQ